MTRKYNDNALEGLAYIFGIKHKPETFKPIPRETIDKKVAEIYTPEVMEKINLELDKAVADLMKHL